MSQRSMPAQSAYRKANRAEKSEIKRLKREERRAAKRLPFQSAQLPSWAHVPREEK